MPLNQGDVNIHRSVCVVHDGDLVVNHEVDLPQVGTRAHHQLDIFVDLASEVLVVFYFVLS